MRGTIVVMSVVMLVGCGSADSPKETAPGPAKKEAAAAPKLAPVEDESRLLPSKERVKAGTVETAALGREFLPGGTVGTYRRGKTEYQIVLVKGPDAQKPATWLLDLKNTMTAPKFVAHFGGYSGEDPPRGPMFAFTKNRHLVVIQGLPQAQADALAREVAARVP